ncbi:tripartite tricarboxylate transporter substrate binding protein [Actinomadura madurae]|uniref:tripartite tricarboxylate transporter substrate binding protein n=1 Tax=Actinomadura madurae TaxID=1993 RepID=UPI002025CF77|nr:tripartite tricarboxylate transporter substrate binding protein [Actinomadura madurae]MCP9953548.1 tripartite tricarboxylate transporter substrate binding protein [Actinomadura madurae]URM99030.1 tripartite tricarboxylate transporter substrate binding protein [Actinomadura madurae]URN09718.1 tripartite tricarboxylate transporter substrate binding protein [Actinomadura madurae]
MKKRSRMAAVLCAVLSSAACGLVGAGSSGSDGADYPSKEVRILVPFAAGGTTDLLVRTIAKGMEKRLDKPVVVENKPGAGGGNAYNEVLRGEPDGYTLCDLSLPFAVISSTRQNVGYTMDRFQPIGVTYRGPNVVVVPTGSRYQSAKDLFDAARAKPGDVEIATAGATVSAHIEIERLQREYKVPIKPVPFEGVAPALTALLGKNVDAGIVDASKETLRRISAGELRALAVTSPERAPYLPDVPTFKELGYTNLTLSVSIDGLAGPKGMPAAVTRKLQTTLQETLRDPEVIKTIGENYVPKEFVGPEPFAKTISDLQQTYSQVFKR